MSTFVDAVSALLSGQTGALTISGAVIHHVGADVDTPLRSVLGQGAFLIATAANDQEVASELPTVALAEHVAVGATLQGDVYTVFGAQPPASIPYTQAVDAVLSPLPTRVGRGILSRFAKAMIANRHQATAVPPLIVVTHPDDDPEAITCLGMHFDGPPASGRGKENSGAAPAGNDVRYNAYTVDYHGIASREEAAAPSRGAEANAVSSLHPLLPECSEVLCQATYSLLPAMISEDRPTTAVAEMTTTWDARQSNFAFLEAPPMNSDGSMVLRVAGGSYPESVTAAVAADLSRLSLFARLRQAGEEWPVDFTNDDREDFLEEYFLAEEDIADHGGIMNPDDVANPAETDAALGFTALPQRSDLDYTERLWLFLKDTPSEDDLRECLSAIFDHLRSDDTATPFVHKANHTTLGVHLRAVVKASALMATTEGGADGLAQARSSMEDDFKFWLEEPLECLFEIGLYHLQRNHVHWMTQGGMCDQAKLEWYVGREARALDVGDQLARLQRLHSVLEVCMLANKHGILYNSLRKLCASALEFYATDDEAVADGTVRRAFVVPFPQFSNETSARLEQFRRLAPTTWTATYRRDIAEAVAGHVGVNATLIDAVAAVTPEKETVASIHFSKAALTAGASPDGADEAEEGEYHVYTAVSDRKVLRHIGSA